MGVFVWGRSVMTAVTASALSRILERRSREIVARAALVIRDAEKERPGIIDQD
jgi:hypothetical protein